MFSSSNGKARGNGGKVFSIVIARSEPVGRDRFTSMNEFYEDYEQKAVGRILPLRLPRQLSGSLRL